MIRPDGELKAKGVAVLWFRSSGRGYDLPFICLGRALAGRGYTFVLCDARDTESRGSEQGDWDLSTWIDYALHQGYEGVVLAGHGFGAHRVARYQAAARDPRVLGIVMASPDMRWQARPEHLALARKMAAAGRGDDLIPPAPGDPPWRRLSARTLLERVELAGQVFGEAEGEPDIARVSVPILAFFGTGEPGWGTASHLRALRSAAAASPRVDTYMIEGADHMYSGRAFETAGVIASWLDRLVGAPVPREALCAA